MYKTVRKGDASLQYMILPQSDQFNSNGPSPSPPPPPRETCHMILYKLVIAVVVVAICVCGIVAFMTTVYVTRSNHDPFYVIAMSRNGNPNNASRLNESDSTRGIDSSLKLLNEPRNLTRVDLEDSVVSETTEILVTKTLESLLTREIEDTTTLENFSSPENNLVVTDAQASSVIPEDFFPPEDSESPVILIATTNDVPPTSTENQQPSSEFSPTSASSPGLFKKAKMPRVTLKLRENETIPQMYMKAGIATYKKGNITTSVLAHGLSLEGLIFKTPQGTIKPWNAKWSFVDNSSPYAQWKTYSDVREQIFAVLVTLMAVSVVIFCVLTLAQLKASRRRWHNVEEPPLTGRDKEEQEDRSKLLDSQNKDSDDKE